MPHRWPRGGWSNAATAVVALLMVQVGSVDEMDFADSPESWGTSKPHCSGYNEEFAACPNQPCESGCQPQNCKFSDWEDWYAAGGCAGISFSHRSIAVTNNECGEPCNGPKIRSRTDTKLPEGCSIIKEPCEFRQWSEWSGCEDNMTQMVRTRSIKNMAQSGGDPCFGALKETKPCSFEKQPVPCEFKDWQHWTDCSVTCGEGRKTRLRNIRSHAEDGGPACADVELETRKCEEKACDAVDCVAEWDEWSLMKDCTKLQPQRFRKRHITQRASGGGRLCDFDLEETIGCPSEDPTEPTPGAVEDWSDWSECTRPCAGGMRFRHRKIEDPTAFNASQPISEVEPCMTEPCLDDENHDCILNEWSDWTTCDVECGRGTTMRTRTIASKAVGRGKGCAGSLVEKLACDAVKDSCTPVDCKWADWEAWSGCTKSCDGGTKTRHRRILSSPRYGGALCPIQNSSEVAPCSMQSCDGKCLPGEWALWGEWSRCSCSEPYRWRNRQLVDDTYCGAPPSGLRTDYEKCEDPEGKCESPDMDCQLTDWHDWSSCSCTCFGVRERVRGIKAEAQGAGKPCEAALKELEQCNPGLEKPVPEECGGRKPENCILSDWADWAACSADCGGGQRERSRSILTYPSHGGKACPAELAVVAPCNMTSCEPKICKDCEWGQWSDWGDCSGCQGERWRHRSIAQLPNECGRKCTGQPAKEVQSCTGRASQCEETTYCAWTMWSSAHCDNTCGTASVVRTRSLQELGEKDFLRLMMPAACFDFCGQYDVVHDDDTNFGSADAETQERRLGFSLPFPFPFFGGGGGEVKPTVHKASEKTCNELGWEDRIHDGCGAFDGRIGVPGVCGSNHLDCVHEAGSYEDAESFCTDKGARLCGELELLNLEAAGSGCQIDVEFIWSDTPCGEGGHKLVNVGHCGLDQQSMCSTEAENPKVARYGRCCADVEAVCSEKTCEELGWKDHVAKSEDTEDALEGQIGVPGVCGSEHNKCDQGVGVFSAADSYCNSIGARLCTAHELLELEGAGQGCNFADKEIWSSTACPSGDVTERAFVTIKLGKNDESPSFTCRNGTSPGGVIGRCCADTADKLACQASSTASIGETDAATLAFKAPAKSVQQVVVYDHTKKHECGGTDIETWEDGENANHGGGDFKDIKDCKEECSKHASCKAFQVRKEDRQCSFWKGGEISPKPNPEFGCYSKKQAFDKAEAEKCMSKTGLNETQMETLDALAAAPVAVFGMDRCGCMEVAYKRLAGAHACFNWRSYHEEDSKELQFLKCMYGYKQESFVFFGGEYYGDGFLMAEHWLSKEDLEKKLSDSDAEMSCKDNVPQGNGGIEGVSCFGDEAPATMLSKQATAGAMALAVENACGFKQSMRVQIGCPGDQKAENVKVQSVKGNNELVLETALGTSFEQGVCIRKDACGEFSSSKEKCLLTIIKRPETDSSGNVLSGQSQIIPCKWMPGDFCQEEQALVAHNCPAKFHQMCTASTTPQLDDYLFISGAHAGGVCSGMQQDRYPCPERSPCLPNCVPKDCSFGQWSEWMEPTCVGLSERHRVMEVMANECGEPCKGPIVETRRQSTNCTNTDPVDCVLSEWTPWSHCRECSQTEQKYRSRTIVQSPQRGGAPCPEVLQETATCGKGKLNNGPCEFADWSDWFACSASCDGGTQWRQRSIAHPNSPGMAPCQGETKQLRACAAVACSAMAQVNCSFSDWRSWGECDENMERSRRRQVTTNAQNGGLACTGPTVQMEACPGDKADCVMSFWTAWSTCDKTCGGGQQQRQRQIQTFPQGGGKECSSSLQEVQGCAEFGCDGEDCSLTDWESWGACSATCGAGHQTRSRAVRTTRKVSGVGCQSALGEYRPCLDSPPCDRTDCEWGDWHDWEACTCTCGGGMRARTRLIKRMPRSGGKPCDPMDKEIVEPCNTQSCSAGCKDGSFSDWTFWSDCSATCVGGQRYRTRMIADMADSCGNPPVGKTRETEFCNAGTRCLDDTDCIFSDWGMWSGCTNICNGIKRRSRQISQYGKGGGTFCRGGIKEAEACNTDCPSEGQATDCQLEPWSDWSSCTRTCGDGQHSRTRSISVPASNGGKPCDGTTEEVRQCNEESCSTPSITDCVPGDWEEWGKCDKCGGQRMRHKKVTIQASHGGRPCSSLNMEEVGPCPEGCEAPKKYCGWADWGPWSRCSTTCGAGQRGRRRDLVLSDHPAPLQAVLPEPEIAGLDEQYQVVGNRLLDPSGPGEDSARLQELVMSFSGGCLFFLIAFLGIRWCSIARPCRRETSIGDSLLPMHADASSESSMF